MTEARLLTTDGGYVTTLTVPDDAEPPESYRVGDRSFERTSSVSLSEGNVVWIYTGPPEPPTPEPPPIDYPPEDLAHD
jgi:hypothetical protein